MENLRTHRISVRLNDKEMEDVKSKATKARISTSTFLRNSALDKNIKLPLGDEELDIYRKIAGMSNNLNQLVKTSHVQGTFALSVEISNTLQQLNNLLSNIK